jgi:phosphatidyl-myo-inositol alpha-mannosyltransferase
VRIGLVCPYDLSKPGGVQQIVLELARQLQDRGDEVVVVSPGEPSVDPGVPFESVGASLSISANRSRVPMAVSPKAWRRTLRAIRTVEVVNIHEPFIPVVGWAALSRRGVPTVATFHADPPSWVRTLYRGLSAAGRFGLGSGVVTATSTVSAHAVPARWGVPRIVPNAIAVASYDLPVERKPNQVAFLGRDDPRKGLSVLLDAWPAIRQAHPDAELEVLGANRPKTVPGVSFHGRADEGTKRAVLASSRIYVAPNLGGESFGIVVAEGMAAGCAVVASDIEAFRQVLAGDGILVPPGDSRALAGAVSKLLDDQEKAGRLGRQAREAVSRYDWSVVTDAYRKAYEDALALRGGSIRD